jgi:signal transduction histidine kinase
LPVSLTATRAAVVGRSANPRLPRRPEPARRLVRKEEVEIVTSHEGGAIGGRYRDVMGDHLGSVARADEPFRRDLLVAVALTVAGELEILLAPGDGSQLVSALALAVAMLALAWRRRAPLAALFAIAAALLIQAPLDGFLVDHSVTSHATFVLALYSAGRYVAGATGLAAAVFAMAVLVATRAAFDPAVQRAADVILTSIAVSVPLLVGRWVRGQVLLQRELGEKARRLERERERDASQAAEEERMRIAADLHAAVADGLGLIVRQAQELQHLLSTREHGAARRLFAKIAADSREALADVRRVLGVLRHDGEAPRLAPPAADPGREPAPAPAALTATADPEREVTPVPAAPPPPATPTTIGRAAAWRRRRSLRQASRETLDRVLVAVILVAAEIELAVTAPGDKLALAALTAVAIVTPLLWRRRRPGLVAGAVLGAVAVQSAAVGLDSLPACDIVAVICASYAVGAYAGRRAAIAGLLLFTLGAGLHAAVFYPEGVLPAILGGALVPWIVGRTVRGQRLLTSELHESAARSEHAREQQARAAMTAERARVARELHDAVAHNISVIAIQAAGASAIVERDPARAVQIAALIDAVGREALAELGRLVGPLGAVVGTDDGDGDPAAPHLSLARVDGLAMRTRDSGLPVELSVEGEPAMLPAGVDLAAFRIVQEALANASKHAGGARAWVVVRYEERAVEVEIGDDGREPNGRPPSPAPSSGHGLMGMRERVALYGGTLDAGCRPEGGFLVRARLPIART